MSKGVGSKFFSLRKFEFFCPRKKFKFLEKNAASSLSTMTVVVREAQGTIKQTSLGRLAERGLFYYLDILFNRLTIATPNTIYAIPLSIFITSLVLFSYILYLFLYGFFSSVT